MILLALLGLTGGVKIAKAASADPTLYATVFAMVGALVGLIVTPWITLPAGRCIARQAPPDAGGAARRQRVWADVGVDCGTFAGLSAVASAGAVSLYLATFRSDPVFLPGASPS